MKRASDCGLFLLYRAYKAKLSFWNTRDKNRQSLINITSIKFTDGKLQSGILGSVSALKGHKYTSNKLYVNNADPYREIAH